MFFIKNSVKNIYRYRSKYKSFGILYLIVILVFSICTNTFIQMNKITENIIKEYASIAKLDTVRNSNSVQKELRYTKEQLLEFKIREYIEDIKLFKYIFNVPSVKDNTAKIKKELYVDGKGISWGDAPLHPLVIMGYNISLMHLEIDQFTLEKGRMFEKDDEAVIYKNRLYQELGTGWNDLDLGDKIVLKSGDGIYKEFTVVGIKEQDPKDTKDTYNHIIYTTMESAEYFDVIASEYNYSFPLAQNTEITSSYDMYGIGYEALIYFDSPDHYIPLMNQLYAEGVKIVSFFPNANTLINMTHSMQIFSVVFMAITGFIILCVTVIATNILLNTRKYEIAVLRSNGMKKGRLILSCLIENLIFIWGITIVSLIAAPFISPIFTGGVFDEMKGLLSAEMFETITNSVNIELILKNTGIVFGATTVVVVLSLILTCISIIRFEPLKIFNKQY